MHGRVQAALRKANEETDPNDNRGAGSQGYTNYVKNLTPGQGDSAVTDKDAQKSAKASQAAQNEKKLRATRIDDEYVAEKEVKVKDTRRVVDAIRAYDRSKDASRDATYDTDKGEKEKGDIEKKYAKKEQIGNIADITQAFMVKKLKQKLVMLQHFIKTNGKIASEPIGIKSMGVRRWRNKIEPMLK